MAGGHLLQPPRPRVDLAQVEWLQRRSSTAASAQPKGGAKGATELCKAILACFDALRFFAANDPAGAAVSSDVQRGFEQCQQRFPLLRTTADEQAGAAIAACIHRTQFLARGPIENREWAIRPTYIRPIWQWC